MYGAGHEETQRLHAEIARLQRERGEAVGMVQLLQGKLSEAEDETFDLRANMVTVEVEAAFESKRRDEQTQKQVASLESKLSFLSDQLKNAERVKLRALRELEELTQRQRLEQKRLEAEKRLLATKKRKHESAVFAASQSIMTRMSQLEKPPAATAATVTATAVVSPPTKGGDSSSGGGAPVAAVEAQSEPLSARGRLAVENAELIAALMDTASRDLLILFKGSSEVAATGNEDGEGDSAEDGGSAANGTRAGRSDPHSSIHSYASEAAKGSQFHQSAAADSAVSQSVFSQIAGHAHAQVKASLLSFAKEVNLTQAAYVNERAKDLHDALASMIQGYETVLVLAPIVVRYIAAPSDLEATVLCSVLRILYLIIVHSECFQEFLLLASSGSNPDSTAVSGSSSMQHPRITFSALRFASLDEYMAAKKDDKLASRGLLDSATQEQQLSERTQMRAKLLSALCRVIQNNANEPRIVACGLSVLSLWVDLGVVHRAPHAEFKALVTSNLVQEVVLAPKGISVKHKTRALMIFVELVHFSATFSEIETSARRTLFFNRCARMLGGVIPATHTSTATSGTTRAAQEEAKSDLRALQRVIIRLFLSIVITYPSMGIRFVLESTHGHANDDDHDLSVIYYLTQLLNRETFDARTLGLDALDEVLQNSQRLTLIQDAFTLLSLLVRYVDLTRELGGPHHEYSFLSVLYLLSSSKFDVPKNNTISKTAAALVTLMQPSQTASS